VPDGNRAHRFIVASFVDDAVDTDPVGPQASEAATQLMPQVWVPFKLAERIENGIGEQDVERCQRLPGGTGARSSTYRECASLGTHGRARSD
jgi:hypothetical protein